MRWFFNGVTRLVVYISIAFIFVTCSDDVAGPDASDPDPDPPDESIRLSGAVAGPDDAAFSAVDPEHNLAADQDSLVGEAEMETDTLASSPAVVATDFLDGETPLAGTGVVIYILDDYAEDPAGAEPAATATTDQEGNYEADGIPAERDLLILVESEPRLSTVVPGSDDDLIGDINTATTLAAEYHGPDLVAGMSLPEQEFLENIDLVSELLEDRLPDELADALVELIPENFGDGFPDPVPSHLQYLLNALSGIDLSVCEDIEFAENSARPTNVVDVYGLAEDFGDEPWAWFYDASVESPGNEDRQLVYVERTDGDAAVLVVPLHPGNVMDGGPGEIAFFDENEDFVCPGREFNVEPLASAPGTFEDLIDDVEEFLEVESGRIGYDPEELRHINISDLNDQHVLLAPLAAGLQLIDGPNYPNNFRNRLSGDAPRLEGESLDDALELVNALAAEAGYTSLTDNLQNGNEAALVTQAEIEPHMPECLELPWNISTPDQLDCWMGALEVFDRLRETIRTVRAPQDKIIGLIASYGPEDPGAFDPVSQLAEAAAMSESMMEALRMYADLMYHLLPAELTHLEIEADPASYNEDDEQAGGWQGVLSAKSQDYTFNFIMAMEPIPQLGAGNVTNMLARKAGRGEQAQELIGEITDILVDEMEDLDIVERDFDERPYEVDHNPKRSDPDEKEYFEWELETLWSERGLTPFIFTDDERGYQTPQDVGASELQVRTPGGDVFRGQVIDVSVLLEANAIEVDIIRQPGGDTSPFYVGPGEEVVLHTIVEYANDESVEWEASSALIEREITDSTAVYEAPGEGGSYGVRAESTADQGLRRDGQPVRFDLATIIVDDFHVTPDPACIELNETVEFRAFVDGEEIPFTDPDLDWTVTGPGSLDNNGLYVSASEGDVRIEFEYQPPEFEEPLIEETEFVVEEFCHLFAVESEAFNHISECVFGESDQGKIVNQYLPYEDILLQIMDQSGAFSQPGEWEVELSGYLAPPEEVAVLFELQGGDVQWFGPAHRDCDPGYPVCDLVPVGNQTVTVQREIREIDGEEVALFSGHFTNMIFMSGQLPIIIESTMEGSGHFRGVPDFDHDPPPSEEWLKEWICPGRFDD